MSAESRSTTSTMPNGACHPPMAYTPMPRGQISGTASVVSHTMVTAAAELRERGATA